MFQELSQKLELTCRLFEALWIRLWSLPNHEMAQNVFNISLKLLQILVNTQFVWVALFRKRTFLKCLKILSLKKFIFVLTSVLIVAPWVSFWHKYPCLASIYLVFSGSSEFSTMKKILFFAPDSNARPLPLNEQVGFLFLFVLLYQIGLALIYLLSILVWYFLSL